LVLALLGHSSYLRARYGFKPFYLPGGVLESGLRVEIRVRASSLPGQIFTGFGDLQGVWTITPLAQRCLEGRQIQILYDFPLPLLFCL